MSAQYIYTELTLKSGTEFRACDGWTIDNYRGTWQVSRWMHEELIFRLFADSETSTCVLGPASVQERLATIAFDTRTKSFEYPEES